MSKILIVGDVHLSYMAPSTRIDNYPTTILNKVQWVLQYALDNSITDVYLLGDIFHTTQQPTWYVNMAIRLFNHYRSLGIRIFTLVGNHDVSYGRLDKLNDSPLGTLVNAGVLERFQCMVYDDTHVMGVDYGMPVPQAPNDKSMLLAHMFYAQPFGKDHDNLTKEQVEELGYKMIVLGHDHNQYDVVKVGDTRIFRFGALSRGTSHRHHLIRTIQVLQVETGSFRTKLIPVPHEPSDRVFTHNALEKYNKERNVTLASFRDDLAELVAKMSQDEETSDVRAAVESMGLEPEVEEIVLEYLREAGVDV